jgi:hypothetical protein
MIHKCDLNFQLIESLEERNQAWGLKVPIDMRVRLGELDSGAGLRYVSPHTHERTPNFSRTFQYPDEFIEASCSRGDNTR